MDSIITCTSLMPNFTSISNRFIEDYMLAANGSYVKVYLYLAKCIQNGDRGISITSLADQMENTEKDVLRALRYWQKMKLLALTYSDDKETITGIEFLNPEPSSRDERPLLSQEKSSPRQRQTPADSDKSSVSNSPAKENSADIKEDFTDTKESRTSGPAVTRKKADTSSEEYQWMLNILEKYLNRMLTPNDAKTILVCYETLNLSTELVLYLYEYCISRGKTNPAYIEKVAVAWAEKGVTTIEDAKAASASYHFFYNAVCKAFALNRALAPVERRYVDNWTNELKMDLSVITEACNRTMLRVQRADFDYADKIIRNWHNAGLHTLEEINQADQNYEEKKKQSTKNLGSKKTSNQFNGFTQRNYTKEESVSLEQKLLKN